MDGYSGRFECGSAVDGDALAVVAGVVFALGCAAGAAQALAGG